MGGNGQPCKLRETQRDCFLVSCNSVTDAKVAINSPFSPSRACNGCTRKPCKTISTLSMTTKTPAKSRSLTFRYDSTFCAATVPCSRQWLALWNQVNRTAKPSLAGFLPETGWNLHSEALYLGQKLLMLLPGFFRIFVFPFDALGKQDGVHHKDSRFPVVCSNNSLGR